MIQKMLREIRGREERGWWGLLKGRGYKWRKFLMHWWGEGRGVSVLGEARDGQFVSIQVIKR